MALTKGDVAMWEALTALGVIPDRPRVLEIGQANWYGDAPVPEGCESDCKFEVARKWYRKLLDPSSIAAIDFHGKDSLKFDLNEPLPRGDFDADIIINTGTAEHIFDQRQLFQTIHEQCAVGGLMVHAVPWQGWENHGFYCYQPTFFQDLARVNRYEWIYDLTWNYDVQKLNEEMQHNTMLYVCMRQTRRESFRVPIQGAYLMARKSR